MVPYVAEVQVEKRLKYIQTYKAEFVRNGAGCLKLNLRAIGYDNLQSSVGEVVASILLNA